jgi:hypothetical protein
MHGLGTNSLELLRCWTPVSSSIRSIPRDHVTGIFITASWKRATSGAWDPRLSWRSAYFRSEVFWVSWFETLKEHLCVFCRRMVPGQASARTDTTNMDASQVLRPSRIKSFSPMDRRDSQTMKGKLFIRPRDLINFYKQKKKEKSYFIRDRSF